jgi:hypothetical protein
MIYWVNGNLTKWSFGQITVYEELAGALCVGIIIFYQHNGVAHVSPDQLAASDNVRRGRAAGP